MVDDGASKAPTGEQSYIVIVAMAAKQALVRRAAALLVPNLRDKDTARPVAKQRT